MGWTGNFKTRIEDLAGTLTVSDDAAIQQWIKDGCYDVLRRIVAKEGDGIKIEFAANVTVTSKDTDISGYQEIISVDRKNGGSVYVTANKAPHNLEDKYADAGSLYFATGTTPVYIQKSQTLSIYPSPSASDTARIFYIPEYSITNWDSSTSSIQNYPQKYYRFVALYGAIQSVHRQMSDIDLSADITPMAAMSESFTLSATFSATLGAAPAITTVTYTPATTITIASTSDASVSDIGISTTVTSAAPDNVGAPTAYTSPSVTGGAGLTGMEAGTIADASDQIEFDTWWDVAGDLIETEEDLELAQAQIQKIGAYINAFNAEMNDAQNALSSNTTHYQAIVAQENQAKQDANRATLQTITNDLQKAQVNMQKQQTIAMKNLDKSVDEKKTNAMNAHAKALQDAQSTVQAIIQDNDSKLKKYQVEIDQYTSEVNVYNAKVQAETATYQQKLQRYAQDLQKFQSDLGEKKIELERKSKDYEWLSANYARLRAEYESVLAITPTEAREGASRN